MPRVTRVTLAMAAVLLGVLVPGNGIAWAQAVPIGSSVQQYGGYVRRPDVAYDSQNHVYLVVWGGMRGTAANPLGTIRGIFVSEDGLAVGSAFQVSQDQESYAQIPRVAYSPDAGAFLVVWHSSEGANILRGRMVSYTTGVSASPAQAISATNSSTRHEGGAGIAYSTVSRRFMVAWARYAWTGTEYGADVSARLVDTAGTPVGSEIVVTASTNEYDREMSAGAYPGSNRFVVAWSGSGAGGDFIRAALYDASSGASIGSQVPMALSRYTYVPDIAINTTNGQAFVTWTQDDSATGGWRPFGKYLNDAGSVTTATSRLSSTEGSYDANSLAFNPLTQSFFLVTHGSNTAQNVGFEISAAGTPATTAAVVTSVTAANLTGSFNPRIGSSTQQGRWLIGTAASFSSLWTQVIAGNGVAPPPGGGGGTVNPQLTISPAPSGGTVTGGGLTCGTGGATCQLTFTQSTSVTLQATADSGFGFSGWGGACSSTSSTITVQVDAVKFCSTTFVKVWGGAGTEPSGCLAAPVPVFPAQMGPIGTSVAQYSGGTQNPAIAYDQCHQVYLAVWGLGGTIRGRFINDDGVGVGDYFMLTTGQWAQTPRVIYNPNLGNFLVIWHSSLPSGATELRARTVSYPGASAEVGTVVSTAGTRYITGPAVAYTPANGLYLLVWPRYMADGGVDISARIIDTQVGPVGSEFWVTTSADEYDRETTAGYLPSTNRFMVAWSGSSAAGDFIRAKLYDAASGSLVGSPIPLASSRYTYVPEAALNSTTGQVFVTWMQDDAATALPNNGWRPFGNFVDGNGVKAFASGKRLSSAEGAYDANSVDYNQLSQAFFLVTQGSGTLQNVGVAIGGDGNPLGTAVVTSISAASLTGSFNPRVAASTRQPRWLLDTAASFNSLWTQLLGGRNPGGYSITVSPAPTGGMVTGGGIACGTGGTTCQQLFTNATTLTLTATPDSGYTFTGWGGSCSGTAATVDVIIDAAKTCSATFAQSGGGTFQLTVTPTPPGGTVSGGGITCGSGGTTCQVTFGSATPVTLSATPATGYSFTGWGGSCAGTSATTTVQVDGVKTCSATFTAGLPAGPPYTMTISPKPTGGAVTGAGLNCGTGGTLCTASMPASMSYGMQATPDSGYTFGGWSGNCTGTSASLTIQLAGPRTCSATFVPAGTVYQLTVSPVPTGGMVSGGGITCGPGGTTCQVTYQNLASVTLTATPTTGYSFTSWGGSCTGTSTTTTIQVDAVKTCSATFAVTPTYQLTVSPTPTGGTVSGGGITCGTGGATCQTSYGSATPVTLTATPASGYTFTSWGGSCTGTSAAATVQVDAVKTCSATFSQGPVNGPPYTMTISPRPTGGTVTGAGLNCGVSSALCTASMPASMPYGMQATPASGYTFTGWTGDCTGTNPSIYVQLAGPRTCGATFTPVGGTTYSLSVAPTPTNGTVSGGGITCGPGGAACQVTFGASTSVTLTAIPTTGYSFTGWGGSCAGTGASTTVQVDGVRTCTATFAVTPTYQLTVSPTPTGGTVSGGGITCGTGGATCQASYGSATPVTLTATPASGYTFTSWGGSCTGTSAATTVQVDAVKTCSATFSQGPVNGPPYTMTISPRPTGGTVTGAGLNCGVSSSLCTASMPASMFYGMQATPASGYTFSGWTGDCAGTNPSIYVQLAGPRTCGATFTPTGGGTH